MIKTKQAFTIPAGTELIPIGNKGYFLNLKDENGVSVYQVVLSNRDVYLHPDRFDGFTNVNHCSGCNNIIDCPSCREGSHRRG